ncbi:MAG TPA: EAL domain-containing protein, partial [Flavobacteriales bacterium]|nr:EAL domain-containing protein [Flavobacteriales bacterium]
VQKIVPENYRSSVKAVFDQTLQGHERANYELTLMDKNGAHLNVLLNSTAQRDNSGHIIGVVGIGQDVTELYKIQREQVSKASDLSRLIATANAPILGTDRGGRINEWNQMAEQITGYERADVLGVDLVQKIVPENYQSSVKAVFDQTLQGHETANYELTLMDKNGAYLNILLNSTAQRDNSGHIIGVVGIGQDVTELNRTRKEFEKKLILAANHDDLTDLPNRRYFYDYLQKQLTEDKGADEIGTLLFLDLDRFKLVNDSLGHSVGDQLLKIVSQRLLASVRKEDLVCRLGGDEFVVLLPFESITSTQAAEQAKKIATKIIGALSQPIHVEEHILCADGSIGICYFTTTDSVEEIVKRSDNAMYLAKGDASTHIAFYTDAIHQDLMHQMEVLKGIDEGLVEGQFFMCYQPQFNHLQELIGVEALIRWQHPRLGLLTPDQFIGLAEQYHRINEIGAWVIESVFSQVAQWIQGGISLPKVAINISPVQLLDENFIEIVDSLAQQYRINPEGVVFEITESANIEHFDLIKKVLTSLQFRGYRFSLDDFGTGYASMTHFKRLPFSQVKIDQSFTADIVDNEDSLAIVEVVL